MRYMVALITPLDKEPLLMTADDEDDPDRIALFDNPSAADNAAQTNAAARAWGYEIIEWSH